jgi:uncharacterized protein (TIGR02147 family)
MADGPDVFELLDYRAFLRAHYEAKKASRRGFSYRAFSRRAGLRSPNYLKLVIDGDRNLSPEMAARFAKACGLEGDAAAYFQDLVTFNQAKGAEEKNAAYRRLTGFRRYRSAHRLQMAHAEYHSTWYLPAIRELAARSDFRADPAWIAERLRPPIPRKDAARALDTLLELGLLVREDDGSVHQGEPIVSTGPEMHALHIANYHRMMIGRGAASIEAIPSAERDISALTLCLAPDGIAELKRRLQAFRRELLELSADEDDPEVVVQLNMQLFPLSRSEQS